MFHPASFAPGKRAVLVVPPLLNEAMRANHALREIAIRLSEEGCDVMRFDFFGTGNSMGQPADATIDIWRENIATAARELADISGQQSVDLVAVRFSACVASHIIKTTEISSMAFWDPVTSGAEWLGELRKSQRAAVNRLPGVPLDTGIEFMGHRMSKAFVDDVGQWKWHDGSPTRCLSIYHEQARASAAAAVADNSQLIPFECEWTSLSSQVLYPHEVVESICRSLT